ncbi:conserved hypothetical protein [Neospora caninum Liverpool]|uniref:Uncharacterized protein n=1 Tax=Neospora caninum (strain Liverpool) TaxID=572307 RepID=F0VBE0_NEOCL|nr:conserved hypothetical protein [Neospora caninum Liverpool]CBZ50924.1 conserved hypothetical protein [Neospora caninum Liverpool]CEL68225.1 TPA: hypothetical protein BN1204_039990 [Neospora caninum Liverpool]|eukprot:XP_003880957.1 conserved hypothetical protein [Neospora caninum Liverpool]
MGASCCKNALHQTKPPVPPPDLPPPDPGAPWPGDTFRRAPAETAPVEPDAALPSTDFPSAVPWCSSSVSGAKRPSSPLTTYESCLGEEELSVVSPATRVAAPNAEGVRADAGGTDSNASAFTDSGTSKSCKSLSRDRRVGPFSGGERRAFPSSFGRGRGSDATHMRRESSDKETEPVEPTTSAAALNFEDHHLVSYPPPGFPSTARQTVRKPESQPREAGEAEGSRALPRSGSIFTRFRQSLNRRRDAGLGSASPPSGDRRRGLGDAVKKFKQKGGKKSALLKKTSSSGSTEIGGEGIRRRSTRATGGDAGPGNRSHQRHPAGFVSPDSEMTTTAGSPVSNRGDDEKR